MRNALEVAFHFVFPGANFMFDLDIVAKRKGILVKTNFLFPFGKERYHPGTSETLQVNHLVVFLRTENPYQTAHLFPFAFLLIERKNFMNGRMVFQDRFISLAYQYIYLSIRVQTLQLTYHRSSQNDISQKSCLND
ncbi:hypothetical protein D3C86_1855060 [compost metagenome]